MKEIEPGLRAALPIARLSRSPNRCIIAYYLQSPLSADGTKILYFEFDRPTVDVREPDPLRGQIVIAEPDGSHPQKFEAITVPSPSSGAQAQWCGGLNRICYFLLDEKGRTGWEIMDADSGERWGARGQMRHVSPDGRKISFQDPNPYAEDPGREPRHKEVTAEFYDYERDEFLFRISVADMLAVYPDPGEMAPLHLGIKKPLFSPDGRCLSFVLSNKPYCAASGSEEPQHHELLIANHDGSGLRYLAPFLTHPSWHPNGEYYCALVRSPEGGLAFGLYPVDAAEDPLYWKHPALRAGHPSIQPVTHQYLVNDQFDRERGMASLWLYSTDDWSGRCILEAEYTDYSNPSGTHLHPAWSPDGRSIYLNSAHLGHSQVYRIDLE